jgi:acetyltransferase-like isoleucine patch superfamily enzyme
MATARGVLSRAARGVRSAPHRAIALAAELQPARRTMLRVPADRQAPPPRAFARFGAGSWLVPPIRVEGAEGIDVGDGVAVLEGAGLFVAQGARLVLGDGVRIGKGVEIVCSVGVTIGAGVSASDYAAVTDSWSLLTGPAGAPPPPPPSPVVIEEGAYLGCGSTVGPGVRVGAGAYIGEGAVVLSDVPAHHVVYGNPAQVVRRYDAASLRWIDGPIGCGGSLGVRPSSGPRWRTLAAAAGWP